MKCTGDRQLWISPVYKESRMLFRMYDLTNTKRSETIKNWKNEIHAVSCEGDVHICRSIANEIQFVVFYIRAPVYTLGLHRRVSMGKTQLLKKRHIILLRAFHSTFILPFYQFSYYTKIVRIWGGFIFCRSWNTWKQFYRIIS